MLKRICALSMLLCLLFSTGIGEVSAQESTEKLIGFGMQDFEDEIPLEVREAMIKQVDALNNYQNLMEEFTDDITGNVIYPEEYAGAYIDAGELVIQLVDDSPEIQEKYKEWCESEEKLSFNEVAYSLNDLLEYEPYVRDMVECGYDVIGYGICEKDNTFEISLDSASRSGQEINLFSMAEDDTSPVRITYEDRATACATMRGGDGITNGEGHSFSIGICGTYNGQKALLTCGHGNEIWGNTLSVYYSNSEIGEVSYQRANTSSLETGVNSLGDFAIVTLNNDVTITNDMIGGREIIGTYSSIPEGTTIYKYGQSTGLSYGTVTRAAINTAFEYHNEGSTMIYYVRGLYKSSLQKSDGTSPISGGDSGGPVFLYNGTGYVLHGIVSAQEGTYMYSTPIYYAVDAGFTVKVD